MSGGWFLVVVVVAFAILVGGVLWSREARLRRRRRKSHSRVVSRSDRPTVRFSVRPPRKKE